MHSVWTSGDLWRHGVRQDGVKIKRRGVFWTGESMVWDWCWHGVGQHWGEKQMNGRVEEEKVGNGG